MGNLIWILTRVRKPLGNLSGFFKKRFPFSHGCDISRTTLFLEKVILHTFSEWLLRYNCYIFGAAAFFSFFRTVTFSQQLFFQNSFFFRVKILHHSQVLYDRLRSSLWQLLFGTAIFYLYRIKISKKDVLFQNWLFCTVSTFSEKLHFGKS